MLTRVHNSDCVISPTKAGEQGRQRAVRFQQGKGAGLYSRSCKAAIKSGHLAADAAERLHVRWHRLWRDLDEDDVRNAIQRERGGERERARDREGEGEGERHTHQIRGH